MGVDRPRTRAARAAAGSSATEFSWGSPWRALCESPRAGRNRVHRASYSSWRTLRHILRRHPCATLLRPVAIDLSCWHRLYRFRGGRRLPCLAGRWVGSARRTAVARRTGAPAPTTPACKASKRPTSSRADAARQTDAKQAAEDARQGAERLRQRAQEVHARHRAQPVACTKPGTTWATRNRKLGHYEAALDRLRSRARAEARLSRGHRVSRPRLSRPRIGWTTPSRPTSRCSAAIASSRRSCWRPCRPGSANIAAIRAVSTAHRSSAFASWVSERSAIASQTAGLTREGASAAW